MIAEKRRTLSPAYMTTWEWRGRTNGGFETWFSKCQIGLRSTRTGIILIVVAAWFMLAGGYADFLVWRTLRKRDEPGGGVWVLANSTYGRTSGSRCTSVGIIRNDFGSRGTPLQKYSIAFISSKQSSWSSQRSSTDEFITLVW